MVHTKFCDLRTCTKAAGESRTDIPNKSMVSAYSEAFLSPATVGSRKGIFVPRELVNKLAKLVRLYDVEGLTIGAYVTNILIDHFSENRDVINAITSEGEKTVAL